MATKDRPIEPSALDFGTLALFTGYALSDAAIAEVKALGHEGLRFSHGFVFQHLVQADRTITELAERMELTQQAASKAVAELEDLGYLERAADREDGRVRRVRLTKRGRAAIEAGRAVQRRLMDRLEKKLGAARLEAARKTLAEVLESFQTAADIRARKVRPPR
jgi:DNA-binding MarR family transcriptional regulator